MERRVKRRTRVGNIHRKVTVYVSVWVCTRKTDEDVPLPNIRESYVSFKVRQMKLRQVRV